MPYDAEDDYRACPTFIIDASGTFEVGFAGADTWGAVRAAGRDPSADLARHESNAALEAANALFTTGMTGTNVMDLVLGLVTPPK